LYIFYSVAGYSSISTFVRLATLLDSAHSLSGTDWSIHSISRLVPIALSGQKQWSVNPAQKNKGDSLQINFCRVELGDNLELFDG
jgi:hypothetical protein